MVIEKRCTEPSGDLVQGRKGSGVNPTNPSQEVSPQVEEISSYS